jgi:type IV/VI secretion system ImpK/VasF family protein
MTLLDLAEPTLQYVCRLNQMVRVGAPPGYDQVRGDVDELFENMRTAAGRDARLAEQARHIETVLMFFVDNVICESSLPFAPDWRSNRLATRIGERAGDEKFFDLLETDLAGRNEAAMERLPVYYACIGLGFKGIYAAQPDELRQKMLQISSRIRTAMDAGVSSRICPEAYQNTDTRNLVEPPARSLVGIGIALVGLIIVLFVATFVLFKSSSSELMGALNRIRELSGHAEREAVEPGPDDATAP